MTRQGFDSDEDRKKKEQSNKDGSNIKSSDDKTPNNNLKIKKPSLLDRLKRKKKSEGFDSPKT
jgi:hypothetical protein